MILFHIEEYYGCFRNTLHNVDEFVYPELLRVSKKSMNLVARITIRYF